MGQFAVIHVTKGSGNGSALGNHIDRIETLDKNGNLKNNFNNADSDRKHLNQEFAEDKFKNLSLAKAVSLRITEGYKSCTKSGELKKIAKDAVKFVEVNLTGSNERMKEMESTPGELEKWIQANYEFACEKYGKENIIRFSLHRDETTPHIHCVIVPLTADGRLSAKEVVGNRNNLKNLQDNYAEAMKSFGLERGVEGSLAAHTGREDYIKKQNLANKEVENLTVKSFFGVDKDKTIENLKEALIQAKTTLKMNNTSLVEINKRGAVFKTENSKLTEKIKVKEKEVTQAIKEAHENYKKIIFQPEVFNRTKIHFEKIEKRRADEKETEKKRILEEKRQSKGKGFRS
jgi:hypothetical protein